MRFRSLLAGGVLALAFSVPADAARIVTWETDSRFVNPGLIEFNNPPPGAPQRAPGLRVNVYLPDGYDGKRRFPVLYLLHGHGDTYEHWANGQRGDLMNVARGFPAIVVMPEGARGWYTNWWNGGGRGNPGWEHYHLEELIPMAERRLKIRRGRRWHAIAGLSMGGEGAAFYAAQRPGYFGAVAVFSGVLSLQRPDWPNAMDTQGERHQDVFGDPEDQRFYWTGHNPTALIENLRHTRAYVTVGDGTPAPGEAGNVSGALAEAYLRMHSDDFTAAARSAKVDITYEPRQGIHDWPYWREHLAAAIKWGFFRSVPERPRSWTYETVAERSEAFGVRFDFRSGPPEELATFKRNGTRISGTGAGRVRVKVRGAKSFTAPLPFKRKLPRPR